MTEFSCSSVSSIGSSKAALQLLQACMPLLNSSNATKQRSDSRAVVNVLGKKLDLPALQQLLLQLTADSNDNQLQNFASGIAAAKGTVGADSDAATSSAAAAKVVCFDLESAPEVDDGNVGAATAAAAAAQLLASLQGCVINNVSNGSDSSQEGAQQVRWPS
jgi:hypothetical protein